MIRAQLHIDATPDQVYDVLADGKRYADWVVGAKHIPHVDADFPRPGSELHHTLGVLAVVARDKTRVLRADRPRVLEFDAHAKGLRAVVRFELLPDEEGTTVVMQEDGANEVTRLLTRAGRPLILARNAETLCRLRTEVENASDGSGPSRREADAGPPLPRWLGDTTARMFALAAAIRGQRVLHPRGVTRRGIAHLSSRGVELALDPAPAAIVRFSRGAGLPAWLPDVNGVAVRLVDARGRGQHRDMLFAGVGPGILRHVLLPSLDFATTRFSSVLPYRLGGETVVLTAHVAGARGLTLDHLGEPDPVELEISAMRSDGDVERLLTVDVQGVIDGRHVRFYPGAADGHLVPLGFLNALRDPAYAASQAVRFGLSLGATQNDEAPAAKARAGTPTSPPESDPVAAGS